MRPSHDASAARSKRSGRARSTPEPGPVGNPGQNAPHSSRGDQSSGPAECSVVGGRIRRCRPVPERAPLLRPAAGAYVARPPALPPATTASGRSAIHS